MKILISTLLLTLNILYPRECLIQLDPNERPVRPEKDTYAISPSGHFFIHFDTTGNTAPDLSDFDENGVPDFVDEVGMIADSAHYVLVEQMGYNEEPYDGEGGYDIYIMSYGAGVYGFMYHEGNGISYIQIDNDYVGFNSMFNLTPIQIMQVSIAHEYSHGIQFGYRYNISGNAYFYEMSAMPAPSCLCSPESRSDSHPSPPPPPPPGGEGCSGGSGDSGRPSDTQSIARSA